ncbi:indolepyruvate ferredoxin oxidoreductase subunit alpha [Thermosphaera aggregans]|uniref:Indolepyruvate oxidoreductase subunit IorA n=1 Tax=Thermosphaera aggregans (strain DSM 11486 / M11TL) TaxID=633148 RepID=D5U054_THEAM|nr:indolepyruvate ferredoxin oxidoreductase subunit alpha [Thermosphaera aggregans]ADG90504.1 indolepyruvate ferredoxin oxidoreductase, alpha subunit [Thermosphaera aggregans DSM 11486]
MHPVLARKGETVLLMGNEAVARGALESGICLAAAYPGTPSTEIVETLSEVAKDLKIWVEWSVNEKVAFETAYAAAISGVKSLTAMKHVGLNVAADILMSSAYAGVKAGFVIVSADDPGHHSSQNEQDNRWYGFISHIPVVEPSSPREAYYFTKESFKLSEKYGHPVILRTTTRLSHTRQPVTLEEDLPASPVCKGVFEKAIDRWVLVPGHAKKLKIKLLEIWKKIQYDTSEPFAKIINPGMKDVIIASGIAYSHVEEALRIAGLESKVTILKVNMPVPVPRKPVEEVLRNAERVLIVEELDPVVEKQVKSISKELGLACEIYGKEYIPENDELSLQVVYNGICRFSGKCDPVMWESIGELKLEPQIPPRPPVLCPGCPHRSSYYIVKTALNKAGIRKVIFTGDIGCYTLGFQKPFETQMTSFEMGGAIGIAHGLSKVVDEAIVAVVGDSTFYHAGIPGVINLVFNKGRAIPMILDNSVTAMTGHQPHPGTGVTAVGEPTVRILPENILRAIGFETFVINPLKVKDSISVLAKALEEFKDGKNIAIISRARCALEVLRDARKTKTVLPVYKVDPEKCTGCLACVNLSACPALVLEPDSRKPVIIEELCAGCGLCASICPFNAISVANTPTQDWEKLW